MPTKSLYDQLDEKYLNKTGLVNASFRSNTDHPKSFRLDISNPKWKFSLGNADGKPIRGTLFYNNNVFDGDKPKLSNHYPTKAEFSVEQKRDPPGRQNPLFVCIQLYAPGSRTELLAEFLGQDTGTTASSGLVGQRKEGSWEFVTDVPLYEQLRRKYHDHKVTGNALFSKNSSFRFKTDELGWVFTHARPDDGHGLDGTLFYNENVFDGAHPKLSKNRPTRAGFRVEHREQYVLIQFYEPKKHTELLGEFLVEGLSGAASDSELLQRPMDGEWNFVGTEPLFQKLHDKYSTEDVGHAFFIRNALGSSFHFNTFNVHRGLWDGRAVGHHVVGTLFYNRNIFDVRENIDVNYIIRTLKEKEVHLVYISFYKSDSQTDEPWFEFLAKDLLDTAVRHAVLFQTQTGTWGPTEYSNALGTASKKKDTTRITIEVANRIAEIHCEREDDIYKESFDKVDGNFTYQDFERGFVAWNHDCVAFYQHANYRGLTAFYLPVDDSQTLGSGDGYYWPVTWKNKE